jgi:hypothetical protein
MAPPDTIDALAASVDVIATGTIERADDVEVESVLTGFGSLVG